MSFTVAVLKETRPGETRVAMVPTVADKLIRLGARMCMEVGAGDAVKLPDSAYKQTSFVADPRALVADADLVLAVQPPPGEIVSAMKPDSLLISFIYAHKEPALVRLLRD